MPRLTLVLALLLALPASAQANERFCAAMRFVAASAQGGFDSMPRAAHTLPGSVEEWRGMTRSEDGPVRGAFFALMVRHDARARPNPATARFHELAREIAQCLPDASAQGVTEGEGGARAAWQTPYANISLRLVEGGRELADSTVQITVASRW